MAASARTSSTRLRSGAGEFSDCARIPSEEFDAVGDLSAFI